MTDWPIPLLVLAALALAGCGDGAKTARYLVDPPPAAQTVSNVLGTAELRDVVLPEYAASDEVAWQAEDGTVRSTSRDLWADTPRRAITQILAREISAVSGATVIAEPWPLATPPERKIDVRIERALAQTDGVYRMSGRYFVADESLDGGTDHARSFDITIPLRGDLGVGAVALAQSAAITRLALQIATLDGPGSRFVARPPPSDPFDAGF